MELEIIDIGTRSHRVYYLQLIPGDMRMNVTFITKVGIADFDSDKQVQLTESKFVIPNFRIPNVIPSLMLPESAVFKKSPSAWETARGFAL
jgi:hypothetical protein